MEVAPLESLGQSIPDQLKLPEFSSSNSSNKFLGLSDKNFFIKALCVFPDALGRPSDSFRPVYSLRQTLFGRIGK
jgi:hypothetical protein